MHFESGTLITQFDWWLYPRRTAKRTDLTRFEGLYMHRKEVFEVYV